MKMHVSPRDWKLLSAYLDRQLKSDECARLEARLQVDRELGAALEGLQRLRMGIRSLPTRRVPHNFTLTPQMVGIRPSRRLSPTFGFASALATFVLILVIVGDLTGYILPTSKPIAAGPSQYQSLEIENGMDNQTAEMQAQVEATTLPDGTQPPSMKLALELAETPLFAEPSAAYPAPGGIYSATGAGDLVTPTSESITLSAEPTLVETFTATTTEEVSLAQVVTPTLSSSEELSLSAETPIPAPEEPQSGGTNRLAVRLAEIALAVIAIGTGLVAILARRR